MSSHLNGVHLIELSGHGGIFQHTVRIAEILAEGNVQVTVHTAPSHEPVGSGHVRLCVCSPWQRHASRSRATQVRIAARCLGRTLPHLIRAVHPGQVAHVQGGPSMALTAISLIALRRTGRPVVFSPHNTFSHGGRRAEFELIRFCTRVAHVNVAFSQPDADALHGWGATSVLSPLVLLVPDPHPERVEHWRRTWDVRRGERVVLFAGQVRADKRLDLLVESAVHLPGNWKLAIVGEDRGDWDRCRAIAARRGVPLHATIGFVGLDDFVAAIAAADVVASPYDQGSQSGVLVIATELGVPTVASRVGGLGEMSTTSVCCRDAAGLASAIGAAVDPFERRRKPLDAERAWAAHLEAYSVALAHRASR
jgi:glycosyltransferase involved in cell wall biosynthesis